jgi:cytochrome P450
MTIAIDLASADTFVDGVPYEFLAQLRRTRPVCWQPMPGDEPGFWAVLKHADVVHVAREPNLFSASEGGVVLENLEPAMLDMMRNMLLAMDPPRHVAFRRPVAPSFKRRVIAALEGNIRAICREILADAAEKGDVEFVHEVTGGLPSRVVGELVGIPKEDWGYIHQLAERITRGQDPDVVSVEEHTDSNSSVEMAMYAINFAAQRRAEAEPREDLASVILGGDFGGQPMSDIDFGSFFVQLVTAGNDTTQGMLANGLHALLLHPDQMTDVRDNPSLIPGMVEETLRWANPLHYFRRTATADTTLRDTPIKAGDKVAMYYTSANRDEDVFNDPDRFDVRRSPNPHLAFGIAEHFCLGVHLARLEGKVFFEELLATFATIEQTGESTRTRSNLNNSLKSLPVRLTR